MIQRKFRIRQVSALQPRFWECRAPVGDWPRGYGDRPVAAYLDFLRKNSVLDPLLTHP